MYCHNNSAPGTSKKTARQFVALFLTSAMVGLPLTAWAQPSRDSQDLRLALDRVSLYAETDRIDDAKALLDQLKHDYPNNPQILLAEANLNLRTGNRGQSFSLLNKALALDPGNENILERQRSTLLSQGPFVSGGYHYRRTDLARENFARFVGQATLAPSVATMLAIENNHLKTRQAIRRSNGTLEDFSGNRQRGSLSVTKLYDGGDELTGSLFAGNDSVGAGAQFSRWDSSGATTIQGNLNRPEWDFVESVIENGTKHNIRLERKQLLSPRLQATLGGGYNQYSLEDVSNAASAGTWDLNLAYTYPREEVTLGVYYSVDAEYFTNVEERTVGATTFRPLPASSYEIHSINASISRELSPDLYIEGFGGYGKDRLSEVDGPLFGAALEYALIDGVSLELRGSRGLMGERRSQKEDQLGANLKWRF
jgi:tetratricopeptide (TPR) repeat protein